MASYNELLALIDAYINQNGVQAITGQVLNGVLRAMVDQLGRGYSIMGAADPTTDPGTPDGPETWFASVPGTYTNFDGIQIVDGELALLSYEPSTGFSKNTIYEGFQTVQATIDGNVGTPAVGVSYANGILSFDFHNMKGNPGNDGAPAGFGTVNATVDDQVGTPSVSVSSSGPDTAKNFTFAFRNLKGETGVTSVLATVDNTSGNPQCAVSLNGQQLVLNFTGLKGAQGDTGSSVDYPFTIVNNLTTNDPAQALSAAMGVQLESEVSQLEAKVDGITDTRPSINLFDKTDIITGKSISVSAGTLSNRTGASISKIIPITAGHYYLLVGRSHNSNIGIRCFDSSNNAMKVRVASTGQEYTSWAMPNETGTGDADNGEFLAPTGAVSVQFGLQYNATDSIDAIMLVDLGTTYVVNPSTPSYEAYGETYYSVKESALPKELLDEIERQGEEINDNNIGSAIFAYTNAPTGSIPLGISLTVGKTYCLDFSMSSAKTFAITLRSATGSSAPVTQTIATSQSWTPGTHKVFFSYVGGTYLRIGESAQWSAISNIHIYEGLGDTVKKIVPMVDALVEEKDFPTQVEFMDFSGNLFNKDSSDNATGFYVRNDTGELVSQPSYTTSGYVHLKPETNYIMPCFPDLYGAGVIYVTTYSKQKSYIGRIAGTVSDNLLTFSLPANAYYIRFTVLNTDLDSFMLVEGNTYPSTYKPYSWKPNQYFNFSDIVLDALIEANPLYGKKVCYDGDSIARGGASSSEYGWSPIIAEKNNGTFVSHAVGGGTITNGTYASGGTPRHWICNGVETIYNNNENPDIIIFEGGTNDADIIGSILDPDNIPALFGTWSKTNFVGPFDKDTFCGAVEYMFQKAQSLFPHTKFGFIIAQKMGRNDNSIRQNRRAYFGVIMEICKKWGIPYINLWDDGWLNPGIDSHYNPNLDADGNEAAHSLYRDGQHLTLYGYQIITEKINAWMKTL